MHRHPLERLRSLLLDRPRRRTRWAALGAAGLGLASLGAVSTGLFSPSAVYAASTPPTIEIGSTGTVVRTWQSDLDQVLPVGDDVAVDGVFGPRTQHATEVFQAGRDIGVDGIVGPVTWSAMSADLASAPACTTAQLRAGLGPRRGTAGSVVVALDLTNIGSTACVTGGYPGVSYVTGNAGTQVGGAAVRQAVGAVTAVRLAPGQTASAMLREADPLNYPPASCRLTATRGLRVYPPNEFAALFVPDPGQACADPADTGLFVEPLQPAGS